MCELVVQCVVLRTVLTGHAACHGVDLSVPARGRQPHPSFDYLQYLQCMPTAESLINSAVLLLSDRLTAVASYQLSYSICRLHCLQQCSPLVALSELSRLQVELLRQCGGWLWRVASGRTANCCVSTCIRSSSSLPLLNSSCCNRMGGLFMSASWRLKNDSFGGADNM